MSIAGTESLPLEVGQFGNFETRMLRCFRGAVDDWDEVCSALGRWEAMHLTADNAEPALTKHRGWLMQLLVWGRLVQRATLWPEFPDRDLAARVDARLRHLEDKLSLWHSEMTAAEQDRILNAAFA